MCFEINLMTLNSLDIAQLKNSWYGNLITLLLGSQGRLDKKFKKAFRVNYSVDQKSCFFKICFYNDKHQSVFVFYLAIRNLIHTTILSMFTSCIKIGLFMLLKFDFFNFNTTTYFNFYVHFIHGKKFYIILFICMK